MLEQQINHHRHPLARTMRQLEQGHLTIGFIGGSITDARPRHNWPEPVIAWFVEQYPHARISVENAAIGATGSDLAVFRAKRDLINRGCDLVFVEYAVNDAGEPSNKRMRSREGLVRMLLDSDCDVLFAYTFSQDMYEVMIAGGMPDTIKEMEQLAEHYGIGSIWMGLHALNEVQRGKLRWEEWLPDGLHPTSRGSFTYAESVIAFLQNEMGRSEEPEWIIRRKSALIKPLDPDNWDRVHEIPFQQVKTEGPWVVRRWPYYEWIDQVLETAAVGAKLSFTFEGRGLVLGFDFGKTSAEFRYRFDEGEWKTESRERPDWLGDDGWYRVSFLGDHLVSQPHLFELEVIHGNRNGCKGTNFRLAKIGIIQISR